MPDRRRGGATLVPPMVLAAVALPVQVEVMPVPGAKRSRHGPQLLQPGDLRSDLHAGRKLPAAREDWERVGPVDGRVTGVGAHRAFPGSGMPAAPGEPSWSAAVPACLQPEVRHVPELSLFQPPVPGGHIGDQLPVM